MRNLDLIKAGSHELVDVLFLKLRLLLLANWAAGNFLLARNADNALAIAALLKL